MPRKDYDPSDFKMDYEGTDAAFTCPHCGRVFIVSDFMPIPTKDQGGETGKRPCPGCRKSTGYVTGSRPKGGKAWIEFDERRSH